MEGTSTPVQQKTRFNASIFVESVGIPIAIISVLLSQKTDASCGNYPTKIACQSEDLNNRHYLIA